MQRVFVRLVPRKDRRIDDVPQVVVDVSQAREELSAVSIVPCLNIHGNDKYRIASDDTKHIIKDQDNVEVFELLELGQDLV